MANKFDALVESTLLTFYEMSQINNNQKKTELSSTEKSAVEDASDTNPAEATPEQKQLAILADKRRQQLKQVTPSAVQKLQRSVTTPINQ